MAVSSLAFYCLYSVKVTLFLCLYIFFVYFAGILLSKKQKKIFLGLSIIVGVLPLVLCKYMDFGIGILAKVLSKAGINVAGASFSLVVPLGISYFTFKALGYLADIYKGKIEPEKNPLIVGTYISFFPEMLAGPIDRTDNLLVQLKEKGEKKWENLEAGILLLLFGYFEKMCVADRLGIFVDGVYSDLYAYKGIIVIIAIAFYSLQIYLDFAGCTHMAQGVAKAFGFDLPVNFKQPYMATSVQKFWQTWHMSLMDWLREYIYIPLGGNKKGTFRKYVNMLVVFFVSGIWHGAGFSFIIWGLFNGILQIGGMILKKPKDILYEKMGISTESEGLKWFKRAGTFILMSITWVFFRAQSTTEALLIFKRAASSLSLWNLWDKTLFMPGLSERSFLLLILFLIFFVVFDYLKERGFKPLEWVLGSHYIFKCLVFLVLAFVVIIFGIYGTAYDASNFIYMQF